MKKVWSMLVVSGVAALIVTACGTAEVVTQVGGDDGATEEVETVVSSDVVLVNQGPILGTWILTKETMADNPVELGDTEQTYEFDADGLFILRKDGREMERGYYKQEGPVVNLELSDTTTQIEMTSPDSFTHTVETPEGESVAVYHRVVN